MVESFVDRFAAVSDEYARFRPGYPTSLFDWLAGIAPARDLAWDCATGSGQAAVDLAERFARVIATDASEAQIRSATFHGRVEYRVASAERSGLPGGSVDLVTVAQALHWFDIPAFFSEARRVLKPDGVLAVWTYGPMSVEGREIDSVVQRYYHDIVGAYWPPERAFVDAGYRSIRFPFAPLDAPVFSMQAVWTLPQLLGYFRTWSATARYREIVGRDPVELVRDELVRAWGENATRGVAWPLTLRVGRFEERRSLV
jgi:SAM-dependent methyltransferase